MKSWKIFLEEQDEKEEEKTGISGIRVGGALSAVGRASRTVFVRCLA